jgi:hypothetical protein
MCVRPTGADQVFVLRFWRETTGSGPDSRWRAQVRTVNTRERRVANDVESAFALVLARLNAVTANPDSREL